MAISQLKGKWGRQQDGSAVVDDESSGTSTSNPSTNRSNSSTSSASAELTFKCVYCEETRVIRTQCARELRYTDRTGDVISVKSDEEFKFMLAEFKGGEPIRLQLTRKKGQSETVDSSETAILETMINPVIMGIMQFVNTATSRTFGYSKPELQGQNVKMLMPSSVAERHDSFLSEYLRTGVANIIGKGRVVEARRKDDTILTLELAVSHTRNRKRDMFTGTFSEVTRPCRPRGRLRAAGEPAIVADHKGQILFANAHAAKLFGYDKAALVGKNVRMLMPNPDSANHDTYMRNYLETRVPKVIGRARDVVGMMKDGSLMPLNLTISEQVLGNQSLFTAILTPLMDEAPRPDAKSVLQVEREMLATLAVAAVMIDERGLIQGFNEPAEALWGWKLNELVGRDVKMLMPNPERDRHDGYLKRYLETGKQRVFGNIIPVRLSVSEKKDDSKRIWTAIVQKLN